MNRQGFNLSQTQEQMAYDGHFLFVTWLTYMTSGLQDRPKHPEYEAKGLRAAWVG